MPALQAVSDLSGPPVAMESKRAAGGRGASRHQPAPRPRWRFFASAMLVGLGALLARLQPAPLLRAARWLEPHEPPGLALVARLLVDAVGWYTSSPNSRWVSFPDVHAHTAPLPAGKRKVVFLGPSCGHISYTMGFVAGMLEDAALVDSMRAADAVFGGVSSGALAAMYANAEMHGVGNITFWHRRDMLQLGLNVDRYSPLVLGQEVEKVARAYYTTCMEAINGTGDVPYTGPSLETTTSIPWLSAFPIVATQAGTLRPHFLSSYDGEEQYVSSLVASCFVPVIFGLWPWVIAQGRRVFDGYIGMWLASFPSSYLFLSFLRTMPPDLLNAPNKLPVDAQFDTSEGGIFTKSWPFGDTEWNIERFETGKADVRANRGTIRAMILDFLQS